MTPQYQHALLSRPTVDEQGREGFLAAMRRFLITDLWEGNDLAYNLRQKPAFEKAHGRPPQNYREVKSVMDPDPFYRAFSFLNRATQELLWDTVAESVERQLPVMIEAGRKTSSAGGSLTLDPNFVLPDYTTSVDIHVMPGSFHTDIVPDDVLAGAVYDRGVYIYAYGGLGEKNAALGEATVGCIKGRFPNLKPKRILDMGCGAGMSTHPLKEAYPDAEIYAIDLAAPMLRYAHGRSESMGVPIHYSQQNAGHTNFEDGFFDLIVSNLVLHEIPQKLSKQIIRECYRLLAPGGVHVHNDLVGWPTDPYQEFMAEWNSHHNNEPFERGSGTLDWICENVAAGFDAADVFLQGYRGAQRR
jgi:SAM-dependent methyltransferase